MQLLSLVDKYLENPYITMPHKDSSGWWPSQASCKIKNLYGEDTMAGKCLRAVYWSKRGIKETNPMKARSIRIVKVGKAIEQLEVDRYKEMGIWRGNSIKFYNKQYNISGEIDGFVYDNDQNKTIGVEIKTGYGYKFRKDVLGTATVNGTPKLDNLMQTMLYVDYFKKLFKIVYIDRGNAQRAEYDITLNKDGTPNINNKKIDNGLSIPGCIARFKELEEYLENGTIPPRDFQLLYSKERVKFLYDSGRLTKTQNKEYEKKSVIDVGDWECSYCLAPETLVCNDSLGFTKIENLQCEDKIVGYNSLVTITNTKKILNSKKIFNIKGSGLLDIKCTEDHKWLIAEWENRYDYNSFLSPQLKWIEARNLIELKNSDNKKIQNIVSRIDCRINNKSSINNNRAWILGIFTAEGHFTNYLNGTPYRVGITIHENEDYIADKFKQLVEIEFNIKHFNDKIIIDNRYNKERRSRQITVNSKELASFIRSHVFGRKANTKSLSSGIMTLPLDTQEIFINAAWDGDGSIDESGLWILSTSSRILCLQYQIILWRLGIPASAQYANKPHLLDGYQCSQGYRVVYQKNSDIHRLKIGNILNCMYIFSPISKSEECENIRFVYDITVDKNESFLTEGGIVHNCSYKDYCWTNKENK